MAGDVVLHRLAPAEGAGLERLFLALTAPGGAPASPHPTPIHPELAGAPA
jgi:hypothetical protein